MANLHIKIRFTYTQDVPSIKCHQDNKSLELQCTTLRIIGRERVLLKSSVERVLQRIQYDW